MNTIKIFYHLSQREKVKEMAKKIETYNPIMSYRNELETLLSKGVTLPASEKIKKKIDDINQFLNNPTSQPTVNDVKLYAFPTEEFTVEIACEFFPTFKSAYLDIIQEMQTNLKKCKNLLPHAKKTEETKIRKVARQKKKELLEKITPLLSSSDIYYFETQNEMAITNLTEEQFSYFIPQNTVLYIRTSCSSSRNAKSFLLDNFVYFRLIDMRKFPINPQHIRLSLYTSDEGFDSILSNRVQGYADFIEQIEESSTNELIEHLSIETKFLKAPFAIDEKREFVVIGGIEEELERLIPSKKRRSTI